MLKIIHDDAQNVNISADLIFIDPPFDMPADQLNKILNRIDSSHLVLITTMRQLIGLMKISDWILSFDFVLDTVIPKKSKNIHQPNYTHATGAYLTRNNAKSAFNRKRRERSDTFDNKGYWPTVIRAPRERLDDYGMAKNQQAITDILGCFSVRSVCDMFAGTGTTGMAAYELGLECILIEIDKQRFDMIKKTFSFFGCLRDDGQNAYKIR